MRNALFNGVRYPIYVDSPYNSNVILQNVTIDNAQTLIYSTGLGGNYGSYLCANFQNCIFATVPSASGGCEVTIVGDHNGFYSSPQFGSYQYFSGGNPFQSGGLDTHYLLPGTGSPFRNVGNPAIDSGLLAQLHTMTTYAPQDGDTADDGVIDLGFHYPLYDSDHDTLPDWWEWKYFGGLSQNAEGDPDGDGLSNLQEYQAPSSPVENDGFANPIALPEVGAHSLRIISPNVLEMVRITAGGDSAWNFGANPPGTSMFQVMVNGQQVPVSQVGFKRHPLYESYPDTSDLRIENDLYIVLTWPLSPNDSVEVQKFGNWSPPPLDWPADFRFLAHNDPLRYGPAIHVNQEGYPIHVTEGGTSVAAPQTAIIGYYRGSLGQIDFSAIGSSAVHLLYANNGNLVPGFSATVSAATDSGGVDSSQYQGLRQVDLGGFNQPGEYRLQVDGLGASFPFRIGDEVPMKFARTYALGLYHQRCGTANELPFTLFTHDACHTALASIPHVSISNPDDPFDAGNFPSPESVLFVENTLRRYSGAFDVALLSINSVGDIPTEGPNGPKLIIYIAQLNQGNHQTDPMYFRIFDASGTRVVDKSESDYAGNQTKLNQIASLKSSLVSPVNLWSHSVLTGDQKRTRGASVRTIVDYSPTGAAPEPQPTQAQRLQTLSSCLYPFIRSGTIDVSGGHHDAGDYSKYTINSAQFIHTLVFAADNFPGVANLDNLGIPESGNALSDLLDEAKWEADFLVKMQDSDGGFFTLVYPATEEYEAHVTPDHGDSQIVFPKTTAVTAAAVAALAEIGSSPSFKSHYPTEAQNYRNAASAGWTFLTTKINAQGKDNIYQQAYQYGAEFAHNDELAWAAAAMFAAGLISDDSLLRAWYPTPDDPSIQLPYNYPCGPPGDYGPCWSWKFGWWGMYGGYGCAIRDYAFAVRSGRRTGGLNSTYLSKCETAITTWGHTVRSWSENNAYRTDLITSGSGGYAWSPEFFLPDSWAFDTVVADLIDSTGEHDANTKAILSSLNFEGGCNPNNVGFLPGLGWRRQRVVVNQYYWNAGHALPPTGNPIGSVNHFQDTGSASLQPIFYPPAISDVDPTTIPVFALYDRWADAKLDKSEFVGVQTARSLATAAWLAAQSSVNVNQSWSAADVVAATGTIGFPNGGPTLGAPATAALTSGTLNLSDARVTWQAGSGQPHIGPTMAFQRSTVGESRIEAEAALPDGRRVFGTDTVYVNDPLNGGTGYQPDSSTIALYHFDSNFSDSSGNGYNLTASGNVSFLDNTTWMKNPEGKVARFSNAGDQLQVSFNNSVIQPGPGVSPISIDARIYPRGYKGNAQFVIALRQDYNSQVTAYYLQGQSPAAQFLFCKFVERQTEGGFWHSMLR